MFAEKAPGSGRRRGEEEGERKKALEAAGEGGRQCRISRPARRADFFPPSSLSPLIPPPVIGHARIRVLRSKRRPASAFSSPSPCRLWQADDRDGKHRRLERCHFCGGDTSARKLLRGRRVNSMVSVMVFPHDPRYLANRSIRRLLISLLSLPPGGLPARGHAAMHLASSTPVAPSTRRGHYVAPPSSSLSSPFEEQRLWLARNELHRKNPARARARTRVNGTRLCRFSRSLRERERITGEAGGN